MSAPHLAVSKLNPGTRSRLIGGLYHMRVFTLASQRSTFVSSLSDRDCSQALYSKRIAPLIHQRFWPRRQRSERHGSSHEQPNFGFWTSKLVWKRASINTFRCLVGCTVGDFSALWALQAQYPDLGIGMIMTISMASGLASSMLLETVLLRFGRDQLSWHAATTTAAGMSMVSMLAMELIQNTVDYHLTGGMVNLEDPRFWVAAGLSISAGFLATLPYNYARIRIYGKACH